ncbi:MAG: ferrous iron transport protein B [Bacteroidota bacterium]
MPDTKTVVLVGQPNSGKSTLFNVLSDIKTFTSNYAGTTDHFVETLVNINTDKIRLVDLPGAYSLNPASRAEEITYNYLMQRDFDLIINVVDASLLTRSLELTVELAELGMPMVVALNMYDEAESHGLELNIEKLSAMLGVPVMPTQALHGKGVRALFDECWRQMQGSPARPHTFEYTKHIEDEVGKLAGMLHNKLNGYNGSPRYYAIKSIENPDAIPEDLMRHIQTERGKTDIAVQKDHKMDPTEVISYERHHLAMKISEEISTFRRSRKRALADKLDDLLLHPVMGFGFLLGFFFLYFLIIFLVGNFLAGIVEGPIEEVAKLYDPLLESNPFLWFTINGAYHGVAGVVGIILPYFLPLVLLTAIFEDTGYISRIAFLVDGLFHKIGLHGKSVVPFILGFGCSVPAIYATRMIENKQDRMITGMLIPFIPCSARTAVIFALTAAFAGPLWAMIVFFYVMIIIAAAGKGMSRFLSEPVGLILEIPPLRSPSLRSAYDKTYRKIKDFVGEALLFLILGSIILGWIEYFDVVKYVNNIFAPIVDTALGLPEELGSTLVFGFFRKELIIVMANQALGVATLSQLPMTLDQVIVFIIFVTLYFPCFTTFVVLWREFGAKTVWMSSVLSVIIALISAFLFRMGFVIF